MIEDTNEIKTNYSWSNISYRVCFMLIIILIITFVIYSLLFGIKVKLI